MSRRMLDLFACEGIGGSGYARAGWDVTSVDLEPRFVKRNPFPFVAADALKYVAEQGHKFDAIHASPPCQAYTRGNAGRVTKWPKLIAATREALIATGKPYVIENVSDARPELIDPVALCGCMFGLSTIDTDGVRIHLKRERLFETNWGMTAPRACNHDGIEWFAGAYGGARRDKYEAKYVRKGGYVPPDKAVVKRLLGVAESHDVTWNGLFECIPPAFTQHIGMWLGGHLAGRAWDEWAA
jgi:DNA (cytosine-5)-methyltransferase 1